jgi:cytidylate kinase
MNVVTISRLVGSFGEEIGRRVAGKLGLEFVGRTGLHELAMSCDPEYKDACTMYETEHGPGFFERLFFDAPAHKSLFEALTFEQASRGNVVIVGRGAQVVLHGLPGVFCVGVTASREVRIQRLMKKLSVSREDAEYYLDKYDNDRIRLIKIVFGSDPGDTLLYNLLINTDHYTAENAADVVAHAIEKAERAPDADVMSDRLKNLALAKRVEALVRKKVSSNAAQHVHLTTETGGHLLIEGHVRERALKEKIGKIAGSYPGITDVDNRLKVTELLVGL